MQFCLPPLLLIPLVPFYLLSFQFYPKGEFYGYSLVLQFCNRRWTNYLKSEDIMLEVNLSRFKILRINYFINGNRKYPQQIYITFRKVV